MKEEKRKLVVLTEGYIQRNDKDDSISIYERPPDGKDSNFDNYTKWINCNGLAGRRIRLYCEVIRESNE